jgi:hypothetical protein
MKRFPWFIVIALLCVAVAGIAVVALQTHSAAVAVSPRSVGIGTQIEAIGWPWNMFSVGTWELIRNGSSVLGVISSALQIERWFRNR